MPSQIDLSRQHDFFGPPPEPADRLFFALFPPASTAEAVADLALRRKAADGLAGRPLRRERFHVTLHHIGDFAGLEPSLVERAMTAAAAVPMTPFDLSFDRVRSFTGGRGNRPNRPFVLSGEGEGIAGLLAFQQLLCDAQRRQGFVISAKQAFTPHVTLLYDDKLVAEQLVQPIGWTATEFVLVHSLIGKTTHIPLGRWSARAVS